MKRMLVTRIALVLAAVSVALIGADQGSAHNRHSSHVFGVTCETTGLTTQAASTHRGTQFRIHLQKYLPPNWVNLGRLSGWSTTDDYAGIYQNPIGMPITAHSKRSFTLEPGTYFVWAQFAFRTSTGGWSYHWEPADKKCTIQGDIR